MTNNREEILNGVKLELIGRYHGEHGRIESSLARDAQITTAIRLLKNKQQYTTLLSSR